MFTHYLITRFNIKVSDHGPEKMDSPLMTEAWLSDRLDLFLHYCAPSVLAQTETGFTWLLYFDPETPKAILDRVSFLQNQLINVQIVFVADYMQMIQDLQVKIKSTSTPFVITSRMDNDDIISSHFISQVQQSFVPQHNTIINLNAGYEYSVEDRVLKKWNTRYRNQFITLIEQSDSDSIQSVYAFPHWRLPGNANVINVPGRPYWIYLRHELNYSGSKVTGIPVFIKPKHLEDFPVSVRKLKLSLLHTFVYALKWMPKMARRRLGLNDPLPPNRGT